MHVQYWCAYHIINIDIRRNTIIGTVVPLISSILLMEGNGS